MLQVFIPVLLCTKILFYPGTIGGLLRASVLVGWKLGTEGGVNGTKHVVVAIVRRNFVLASLLEV